MLCVDRGFAALCVDRSLAALCMLVTLALAGCASTPPGMSPNERKADALLQEGVDAINRKSFVEALRALLQADKYNPKSALILTDLGVTYAGMNEFGKAEENWRKALAVDPKHNDARLNLGILYLSTRHYSEAERMLKEAQKDLAYASADQVAYELSVLYLAQNKPLLAEEQLKIAVRDRPANCAAWLQLGMMQKERGDYAEAARSMKGATTGVCYKNPQAHYELATLLLKAQELPQAKAKLLEIIQLFPTTVWAEKSEATLNMIRQ
jgi:protein O-GlcNAc transferase